MERHFDNVYMLMSLDERDEETNEPLFWSNRDGWVFFETATLFLNKVKPENFPIGKQVHCVALRYGLEFVKKYRLIERKKVIDCITSGMNSLDNP